MSSKLFLATFSALTKFPISLNAYDFYIVENPCLSCLAVSSKSWCRFVYLTSTSLLLAVSSKKLVPVYPPYVYFSPAYGVQQVAGAGFVVMSTLTPTTNKPTTRASTKAKSAFMGPADELLDPERRKIIAQLSDYIGDWKLPSTGWALLWFADLEILRKYLKTCEEQPGPAIVAGIFGRTETIKDIIMSCKRFNRS